MEEGTKGESEEIETKAGSYVYGNSSDKLDKCEANSRNEDDSKKEGPLHKGEVVGSEGGGDETIARCCRR